MILEIKFFITLLKLSKNYKFKTLILFLLSFIEAILEVFLILLIPIILSIVIPESVSIESFYFVENIKDTFFVTSPYTNFIIAMFLVFIKTAAMSLIYFFRNKILVDMRVNTYSYLLKSYFAKHLSSFNDDVSNIGLRNLTTEVNYIYQRFISNSIGLISDFILLLFFLTYLIILDFMAVMVLLVIFSLITLLIRYFTYNKLNESSNTQLFYDGKWVSILGDIFSSIKEINIYTLKKKFFEIAKNHILKASIAHNHIKLISQISRQLFEMVAILFFFFILYINMSTNILSFILITKLALFVGCFFRILPTTQRLVVAYQSIKSSKPNLRNFFKITEENFNDIKSDLNEKGQNNKLSFNEKIIIKNLSFSYSNGSVIKDFNCEIKSGDRCIIYGKTGTGKSTLTDLIMGILSPKDGEIFFDDKKINGKFENIKDNFAYVPQEIYLLNDNIKNNIKFFGNNENETNLNQIIKKLELDSLVNRFDKNDLTVGENGALISGGQKQRIGIARALYSNKKIIILDEPSSNLDSNTEYKVFDYILNTFKQKTFIIISHNANLASMCSKKIFMNSDNSFNIRD